MKSLQIAIKKLEQEGLSFILVKEGVVLKKSKEKGIKPILDLYREGSVLLEGGAVADRVMGRAGALLLRGGKTSRVYAQIMSEEAIKIFEEAGIEYSYDQRVPMILDKDMTGVCILEKISMEENSSQNLYEKILQHLKKKQ